MTKRAGQATRSLQIDVLTELSAVEELKPEWSQLADDVSGQPFALPAVAIPWWRELGKGELWVVTVRNGQDELVGLAPFFRRTRARLSTISFLGRGLGAVGELLVRPGKADVAGAVWSALDPTSTVLDLGDYRYRGAGLDSLRHHPDWAVHLELRDECPVLQLNGVQSAEEFLASPKRSGLRKKLARARRGLAAMGSSMSVHTSPDAVADEWRHLQPLYDRAEAANGRLHLGRAPYRDFFEAVLAGCASEGRLALLTLWIGDRRAAFDVYVRSGATAYAILGRFNPDLAEHSPGQLLTEHGAQWAIEAGHASVDLQLGGDHYKRRWATDSYDTLGVVGADPTRLARARAALGAIEVAYDVRQRFRKGGSGESKTG
jgi:CelD/BcsL family acetyltransferase involved in cellulose biosynthesis